jgi:hypothetical protein
VVRRLVARLAACLAATLFAAPAIANDHPFTVNDLLSVSQIGGALPRPRSDTIVWEQEPPYKDLHEFGFGSTGAWGLTFKIMVAKRGAGTASELFSPRPRTAYFLNSFSPDGHYLTLISSRDGEARFAVFDFKTKQLREFDIAPRVNLGQSADIQLAWLSSSALVIAAYPNGNGPWAFTFRRAIGERLSKAWQKSWAGKEVSVDRYESREEEVKPLPGRLLRIDLHSGSVREIAAGQFAGLCVSRDGKWLAALRQSPLPTSSAIGDWVFARSTLVLLSTRNFSQRSVNNKLSVLPASLAWDTFSDRLAFFATNEGAPLADGNFHIMNAETGDLEEVSHRGLDLSSMRERAGPAWPERPLWIDGSITVLARPNGRARGTFFSSDISRQGIRDNRSPIQRLPSHWYMLHSTNAPTDLAVGLGNVWPEPLDVEGRGALVLSNGEVWRIGPKNKPISEFPNHSKLVQGDTDLTHFSASEAPVTFFDAVDRNVLYLFKRHPAALEKIPLAQGSQIIAVTSSGGSILLKRGSGKGSILELSDSGTTKFVEKLNPGLDHVIETRWKDFPYSAGVADVKRKLNGCILLPANYVPKNRYPLIVEIYPDRPGHCEGLESRARLAMGASPSSYSEHLLAARGYIIFRPDLAGGIARSAAGPQARMGQLVDHAIDSLSVSGLIDRSKVGLIGISQGGFSALWLATQSKTYKAVVSLNGWSDPYSHFFSLNWAQELEPDEMRSVGDSPRYLSATGTSFSMGGSPWSRPDRFLANSPLWRSNNVTAPILLIHSDMDLFELQQYQMFFSSMNIQNKRAKLLVYRGEGHSPSSPANIRDMWVSIFDWYDRYLGVSRSADGAMILN